MNGLAIIFLLVTAAALLALPRRWAPLPLLMGACYMTPGQSIDIGPFHFTVLRLLLLLGVIRVLIRQERLPGRLNGLDWLLLLWGAWQVCSSAFHKPFGEALVFRLGIAYNVLGIYFLVRVFCRNVEDMIQIIKLTAFLLVPVALEMVSEKLTGRNLFGLLGGIPEEVLVRDGKLRAQGPFGHAILAGTVGAMCLPLMIGIWRQHRLPAMIGLAACLAMVIASKSSGPLMSTAFAVFALMLWRWRHLTRQMRIGAVIAYVLLEIVMKDPAYFVIARIDLTGSSTGWHRAELMRSALRHLREWWFAGTDYTRHWMIVGLPAHPDSCDITNHYLWNGVQGGLPLMFLFIAALWVGFRYVGQGLRLRAESPFAEQFLVWSLGATLFSHAATCFSIAYFEQSVIFLYLTLAVLGSLRATASVAVSEQATSEGVPGTSTGDDEPEQTTDLPPEGFLARSAGAPLSHQGN
jgi:hypothetical protein